MKYKIIKNECDVCACCAAICPENAIILTEFYATINQELCIGCKKCFIVCPISVIEEIEEE